MSYYDGGNTGSNYRDPGVRFVSGPTGRSYEEKSAKKFIDIIGVLTFDSRMFARWLANMGEAAENRVMEVVKAIIRAYGDKWDYGHHNEALRDARRLSDTLDKFDM